MSLDDFVKIAGALSALIIASIGGWFTYLRAKAAVKQSPYDSLAARVVVLEASDADKAAKIAALLESDQRKGLEIVHLRGEVTVLGEYAVEVHEWIDSGMPPPSPVMGERAARVLRRLRKDTSWQQAEHPDDDPHG